MIAKGSTGRNFTGSLLIDLNSAEWEPTETKGFYTKRIFKDEQSGESTFLMKMDPGAHSPKHSHKQLEEIFVLQGDFYDEEHRYEAGQYCIRAIGAEHETRSENGGVVLLIYRN
jgi:anti-sigma factor ChrR (cupin superfamily)